MGFLLLSGGVAINPGSTPVQTAPLSVTLTGYNAVPSQTDGDPMTTADGGPSNPEVVAARSQDLGDQLPFGTIIEVVSPATTTPGCGYGVVAPLVGYRVITDVMNIKIKDHVDILFHNQEPIALASRTVNASVALGSCPGAGVRVVGHIDLASTPLPATQADLAALVTNSGLALAR